MLAISTKALKGHGDFQKSLYRIFRSHGLVIRSHGLVIRSLELDNSFSRIAIRSLELDNQFSRIAIRSLELDNPFSRVASRPLELHAVQFEGTNCNSKERVVQFGKFSGA